MDISQLLAAQGVRQTPKLKACVRLLDQAANPITAKELHQSLINSGVDMDLVTVYRILEKLTAKNLIKEVDLRDGALRYEIVHEHHHHLVCQQCGRIEAFYGEWLKKAESQIKKHHQFEVKEHILEFFGLCRSCR